MKTNKLIWTLGWITMGSLAALQGCGGDDDDGGDGSSSGGEAGDGTGGNVTGGRGGSTGGSPTGGRGGSTGGTTQGGAGGAPGGMGGEPGVGGEGGGTTETRAAVCTEYCTLYEMKNCDEAAANTYGSQQDCIDTCGAADWEIGDRMDGSGNTVHCRLTHAGLADGDNAPDELHCGHASAEPTGVCVD